MFEEHKAICGEDYRTSKERAVAELKKIRHVKIIDTDPKKHIILKLKRQVTEQDIANTASAHNLRIDERREPDIFGIVPREQTDRKWELGIVMTAGTHPLITIISSGVRLDSHLPNIHGFLAQLSEQSKPAKTIDVVKEYLTSAFRKARRQLKLSFYSNFVK